jgi:hypothetical protein
MSEDTNVKHRGPGRPPRQAEVATERRRRSDDQSVAGLKLHVRDDMKDPNFSYRWANERPGRIHQLTQQDDWDVVSTEDASQLTSASEGTVMRRSVDKATGEGAVLLRKRKDFYEADQKDKQKPLDERDEILRRGAAPSPDGLAGSEAYVPGGRNIVAGR